MKADKDDVRRLLKTVRGQLDGILNMVEEDRYCIDICNQIMAAQSILAKVNKQIMAAHMENCVAQAMTEQERSEKIEEVVALLGKLMK